MHAHGNREDNRSGGGWPPAAHMPPAARALASALTPGTPARIQVADPRFDEQDIWIIQGSLENGRVTVRREKDGRVIAVAPEKILPVAAPVGAMALASLITTAAERCAT